MRVLFLATSPSAREASTRYRAHQYFGALQAAGHEPHLSTFFGERVGTKARRFAKGLAQRATDLARAGDFDVIVVHRELLPYAWNAPVRAFARRAPIVFDFDDAVFMSGGGSGWRNWLAAPGSTRSLVESSTRVFAGNEFLASWARETHRNVDVIPTVVDTDVYRPEDREPRDIPLVGWVGSPTTAKYLDVILPVLDDLARSFRFRVQIVGAGRPIRLANVEVDSPPWSAAVEHDLFRTLDIGLYPLTNDTWALGKCGFKAIQYMACGVASVVSPVGVVRDIVRDGVDGLWAESPSRWKDALAALLESPDQRRQLARAGREHAVRAWSLRATAPRFVGALEEVARS